MDWIDSIISGVVSGVIASVVFFVMLLFVRPNLKVSEGMTSRMLNDGTLEIKIKIVNKTLSMLTNVSYSLYYCKEGKDGIHLIEELDPKKRPITSVSKYSFKKDNTDYAVRLTYNIDPDKYILFDNTKFIFVIMCNHAVSNTTKCIQKEYRKEDVIQNGVFETDKSMKILVTDVS